MRTSGSILELGVGWYSTPLLHEIAVAQDRWLVTADNQEAWFNQFKGLGHTTKQPNGHLMVLVGSWLELFEMTVIHQSSRPWGLVLVDQGQPIEREYAVRKLVTMPQFRDAVYVLHDTEEGRAYGYDRILGRNRYSSDIPEYGLFRHQWTDHSQKTWTTLASLTKPVEDWGIIELPPVEPEQEVT
jgi:hypothetical protein